MGSEDSITHNVAALDGEGGGRRDTSLPESQHQQIKERRGKRENVGGERQSEEIVQPSTGPSVCLLIS